MEFSVVIPTHNRAHQLARALASVHAQGHRPNEVVIVDDGSTDDTSNYLRDLHVPYVRVIHLRARRGAAHARNVGVAASRCSWIAFLDSDDYWDPSYLSSQAVAAQRSSALGLSFTGSIVVNAAGQAVRYVPGVTRRVPLITQNWIGSTSRVVVRRDLLEKTGGFDESLPACQDWDMWVRLANYTRVAAIDRPLVFYLEHPQAISSSLRTALRGRRRFWNKYGITVASNSVRAHHYDIFARFLANRGYFSLARKYAVKALRSHLRARHVATFVACNTLGVSLTRLWHRALVSARHVGR